MMEIANLTVKLSSDVEQAISGLRKSDAALQKSATVADKETKKIEGFMGKMKMGWIAVAAGAIASLYAVAKSSAVIGGYFSEFGMLVGTVFDEIGIAMFPVIGPLLDFLFDCADKFAELPDPIKATTGAIIGLSAAIPTAILALAGLQWAFTTLGISAGGVSAAIIGFSIVFGLAIGGFLVAYYTNWQGTKDKVNAAIDEMRDKLSKFSPSVGNIFATIARYPGLMFSGKMLLDPEQTAKTLEAVASAIDNSRIVNAFRGIYDTIKMDVITRHKELKKFWGDLLKSAKNIWDSIGNAIWKPIQSAYNKIRDYIGRIISKIRSIPVIGSAASYVSKISKYIPSFQHGGYVPTTGLAMLHAGEYVMPANNTRNVTNSPTIVISPTIYVSGEMRTDTDLRKLAGDLSVYFKDEIKRQVRG